MSDFQAIQLSYKTFVPTKEGNAELTPIIFMHGMLCSKEMWEDIPQVIADKSKRKVYSYDARNHGESQYTEEFNFDLNVADLFKFMDQNEIDKAILVGHSMGGLTAIIAALKKPERVEKIFPVDIFLKTIPKEMLDMLALITTLKTEVVRSLPKDLPENEVQRKSIELLFEKIPENIVKEFESERESMMKAKFTFKRTPDGGYDVAYNSDAILQCTKDPEKLMTGLTGQYPGHAYFLYGTHSQFSVPAQEAHIKEHFPEAELIAFEGASHNVYVDLPDKFIQTILDHL